MTRSLKVWLTLGFMAVTLILLCGGGATVYLQLRHGLYDDFDRDLHKQAMSLTALTEQYSGGVTFDWSGYDAKNTMTLETEDGDGYIFLIESDDGGSRHATHIFGDEHAPISAAPFGEQVYRTITLPDGTTARLVSFEYLPPIDDELDCPNPQTCSIVVARRTVDLELRSMGILWSLMGVGIGVMLIGLLLILCLVGISLRSLSPVIRQLDGLGEGDLDRRVDGKRLPTELQPLISSINRLLADIQARMTRERRFISDSAHEFRTPIAGARANLDLLSMQQDPMDLKGSKALEACRLSVEQLKQVCDRLMLLAGLDDGRYAVEMQEVDLLDFIESTAQTFARGDENAVRIKWTRRQNATVKTDPVLLSMIVFNLLDNAAAYRTPNTAIEVATQVDQNQFSLRIRNELSDGIEIDGNQAVEPFWRADTSRSFDMPHAGLGLAICKSAAEKLGGDFRCGMDKGPYFVATLTQSVAGTVSRSA